MLSTSHTQGKKHYGFPVRIKRNLKTRLEKQAEKKDVTLTHLVNSILEKHLSKPSLLKQVRELKSVVKELSEETEVSKLIKES